MRTTLVMLLAVSIMASGCITGQSSPEGKNSLDNDREFYVGYKTFYDIHPVSEILPREPEIEQIMDGEFTAERTFSSGLKVVSDPNITEAATRKFNSEEESFGESSYFVSRVYKYDSRESAQKRIEKVRTGRLDPGPSIVTDVENTSNGIRFYSGGSDSGVIYFESVQGRYVYSFFGFGYQENIEGRLEQLKKLMERDAQKELPLVPEFGENKGRKDTREIAIRLSDTPTDNSAYFAPYNLSEISETVSNDSVVLERTYRKFYLREKVNDSRLPKKIISSATEYRTKDDAERAKEDIIEKMRQENALIEEKSISAGINATLIKVSGQMGKNLLMLKQEGKLLYFVNTKSETKRFSEVTGKLFIKMIVDTIETEN
jgi:hypothetical protein